MNISLTVFKTKNNASFLARLPAAMASSQGNHLIWTEEEEVETQALKKIKTKQNKNQLQQKKNRKQTEKRKLKMWLFQYNNPYFWTYLFWNQFSEIQSSHLCLPFLL